ncbi:hypothetical protein A4X13_0g8712 [Tilletia indica]|uniref:FHA domain-containing protein n=1 Tax=Tilletia indica TaxID=43049 RepID=A0A177T0D4_9BASI|nr:hypothetical protein A4X13_0g8712 [Tilletia indica]
MPLQLRINPDLHSFVPKVITFSEPTFSLPLGGTDAGTPTSDNGIFPTDLPHLAQVSYDGDNLFLSEAAVSRYGCVLNEMPLSRAIRVTERVQLRTGDRLQLGWFDLDHFGQPLYGPYSLVIRMSCTISVNSAPSSSTTTSVLTSPSELVASPSSPSNTTSASTTVPTSPSSTSTSSTTSVLTSPSAGAVPSTSTSSVSVPPLTSSGSSTPSSSLVPTSVSTSVLLSRPSSPSLVPQHTFRSSHHRGPATPSSPTSSSSILSSGIHPPPTRPCSSAPVCTPYGAIVGTLRSCESQHQHVHATMDGATSALFPLPSAAPVMSPFVTTPTEGLISITPTPTSGLSCFDTRAAHQSDEHQSSSVCTSDSRGDTDGFVLAMDRIRNAWLALRRDVVRHGVATGPELRTLPPIPPSSSIDLALRRVSDALQTCRDTIRRHPTLFSSAPPSCPSGQLHLLGPRVHLPTPLHSPGINGSQRPVDRRQSHAHQYRASRTCSGLCCLLSPSTRPSLVSGSFRSLSAFAALPHRILLLADPF